MVLLSKRDIGTDAHVLAEVENDRAILARSIFQLFVSKALQTFHQKNRENFTKKQVFRLDF